MAEISSHSIVVSGGSNRYTNNAWGNTITWTGGGTSTTTATYVSATGGWTNTI